MHTIYIPQLAKAPEQTEEITVREYLPALDTLTPVQGLIRVTHRGNYLEVAASAEAIMTLTCDRCLKQYNHRVTVDTSELIWLQEPPSYSSTDLEQEVALEDLVETLTPNGYFQPADWLYEQLCLAMPQRQLCDQKCQGIQVQGQGEGDSAVDERWASLKNLRNQLN
ncbi:YceD family protein [Egbenema bharatensis]|uniref:YceD family protein n=1 Tax=Egbenema bharatensis TaxID=3463334 RepID=UPI003A83DA95